MIDRPVSREALEIVEQIRKLMPSFGKIDDHFVYLVPRAFEKDVRALLDWDGISYHMENFLSETIDFRIFIPEKYQKSKK